MPYEKEEEEEKKRRINRFNECEYLGDEKSLLIDWILSNGYGNDDSWQVLKKQFDDKFSCFLFKEEKEEIAMIDRMLFSFGTEMRRRKFTR